ncbi:DNA methylase, N-6 adenine-specific, conserved site-containing protein [Cynara cardunculus var. scolymus]|uniref:Protein-lysine N-methyltransferase Ccrd_021713 n=1 Tax=Cynara cardunculus var. scolymus TaxID=59895 RepID=A0A103Y023_CYNCS|nr:DNA methylase, N-6 adenine-specific, conserved site-containing protein [Cynara cardunculus var. scolymus]
MEQVSDRNAGTADDDDTPMLSSHALEALREFLSEQNSSLTADNDGATVAEEDKVVALVTEDWRLSQFWYDRETAETVAREVHALYTSMDSPPSVACIACPTLYVYLKKMHHNLPVQLLEYDNRFKQYGSEFTFYDYNQPLELPSSMKHAFRIIIADPPYLSIASNHHWMNRPFMLAGYASSLAFPVWTCAVQQDRAAELLGLRPCGFRPQHSSKLGNEFRLFTNYDPGLRLGGWEQDQ